MAHFYGVIRGQRGEASRLGSVKSGLVVTAASWQGAVRVTLEYDEATGADIARVELIPWRGAGVAVPLSLYDGPIGRTYRAVDRGEGQVTTTTPTTPYMPLTDPKLRELEHYDVTGWAAPAIAELRALRAERDDLLAALKEIAEGYRTTVATCRAEARAAIARAEGSAE